MADKEQQHVDRIERERRRRESILLLALLALAEDSEQHARFAVRIGQDPVSAARNVWLGNRSIERTGAAPVIREAMADAAAAGARRVYRIIPGKPVPRPDPAAFLDKYTDPSRKAAERMWLIMEPKLKLLPAPGDQPQRVRVKRVGEALDDAGLSEDHPRNLEAWTERAIVSAHNDGILSAAKESEEVTGFKHVSVLDSGTTEICDERHGLMLPKEDPYWQRGHPPLHWNCRSICIPILGKFTPSTWRPETEPAEGFGYAPSAALGRFGI